MFLCTAIPPTGHTIIPFKCDCWHDVYVAADKNKNTPAGDRIDSSVPTSWRRRPPGALPTLLAPEKLSCLFPPAVLLSPRSPRGKSPGSPTLYRADNQYSQLPLPSPNSQRDVNFCFDSAMHIPVKTANFRVDIGNCIGGVTLDLCRASHDTFTSL